MRNIYIENDLLKLAVAPEAGGRITSIFNKSMQREFLWQTKGLDHTVHSPGADYDSQFSGGIDELLPNDIPENIDGIDYPDHGELWTARLNARATPGFILVEGTLPLSGLFYSRRLALTPGKPLIRLDYCLRNDSDAKRHFLWKLHAALPVGPGDTIGSTARKAQAVDTAYTRVRTAAPFDWPSAENLDLSIVPPYGKEMDFYYLYNTTKGEMTMTYPSANAIFAYRYDRNIFPYEWLFASYGGFLDHYTAILEPCTNMPLSVTDAAAKGQSALLEPGASIETTVWIYAGSQSEYLLL